MDELSFYRFYQASLNLFPSTYLPCHFWKKYSQKKHSCCWSLSCTNYSKHHLLKKYYEIVNEARPLLGFFSHKNADFVYRNTFIIIKLSNLPSFRSIRALIASQSTFGKINYCIQFIFILSYCYLYLILHKLKCCSVLKCDILRTGSFIRYNIYLRQ